MMKILTATATAVSLALCSFVANAADFKPAVAYDSSGKFDKSFSQAVYQNGVMKFNEETNISVREFVPANDAQREQGLERLARRGFSPVVVVGFMYGSALEKVAKKYPESQFVIIDAVVDLPNVKSIVFKEHEGSFLVGALAAMKSGSQKVGFVGGMDIPLIRKFACGYEQGAKYINKDAEVFQNMTGSTPSAWSDPARGAELTKSQFSKGADVVFAAAGGTGVGVYQAAKDEGKYAIGVDSNQNYMHPGVMLTSMVKRVGLATYEVFKAGQKGEFETGLEARGLKENGVNWALDKYNRDLVTPEMEAKIQDITNKIVSGELKVHDYMADNTCKY
ncbi:BMP family lipoprotein [Shewanella gelidii]|uniref:BMP family ABC transporter substrate-binding protein n=1 Tax=Shewanella gelidii TaxID=1642821 RepID=A0A917NDP4_9GAMM|nr:BMP family ABC transporter substrate-binding protein [Shewanella gelidii]MCL1098119.1 BMP family ABC transporter substrate-binding protein [Shewanella gelidii]GGI90660.1 BMP family ABC transporter substrate-binding protein [Shewanella gelidii]